MAVSPTATPAGTTPAAPAHPPNTHTEGYTGWAWGVELERRMEQNEAGRGQK